MSARPAFERRIEHVPSRFRSPTADQLLNQFGADRRVAGRGRQFGQLLIEQAIGIGHCFKTMKSPTRGKGNPVFRRDASLRDASYLQSMRRCATEVTRPGERPKPPGGSARLRSGRAARRAASPRRRAGACRSRAATRSSSTTAPGTGTTPRPGRRRGWSGVMHAERQPAGDDGRRQRDVGHQHARPAGSRSARR